MEPSVPQARRVRFASTISSRRAYSTGLAGKTCFEAFEEAAEAFGVLAGEEGGLGGETVCEGVWRVAGGQRVVQIDSGKLLIVADMSALKVL
jgi:hypothetical protein